MRIDELIGYKGRPETDFLVKKLKGLAGAPKEWRRRSILSRFLRGIEERGFTRIGNGAFGAVFGHPSVDYVIKVFRNDPAYLTFVKYALDHQDNPHLPKFRGKFMRLNKEYYVVRMEALSRIPRGDWRMSVIQYITVFMTQDVTSPAEVMEWLEGRREHFERVLQRALNPILGHFTHDGSLLAAYLSLRNIARDTGLTLDMTNENCMLRGNEFVFCDPFWDKNVVTLV